MDDWDQETLEKVVESKKNEYQQNKPTDIVSFDTSILSLWFAWCFAFSFQCFNLVLVQWVAFCCQIIDGATGSDLCVFLFFLKTHFLQVCKYFLDAVEKKQYGWFWVCPNGGKNCHYRHALPPGYVLKSQMKALLEEESEKTPLEEEIENQVKFWFLCNWICLKCCLWLYNQIFYDGLACEIDNFYSNDSWVICTMEEEEDRRKRRQLGCTAGREG